MKGRLALLCVSLIIATGIAEYAVRKLKLAPEVVRQAGGVRFVKNRKIVYEFLPRTRINLNMTNAHGFCDSDFTLEKQKNLIRIAMLGDSITQGVFVPPGHTFSDKLENLLNQRARDKRHPSTYEVMNFGVGGYNLAAEVETLKEKVLAYKPDIVVLNLFRNDNEPIPGVNMLFTSNDHNLSEEQQCAIIDRYLLRKNSYFRRFENGVLYRSKLYLFFLYKLNGLRAANAELRAVKKIPGERFDGMQSIDAGFREIEMLRKRYGFTLLICIHPDLLYHEDPNNLQFASLAEAFGFDYFHMISYYRNEGIPPGSLQLKDYPSDTCHPNELGHDLIAKALFLELEKHNFVLPGLHTVENDLHGNS